MEGIVSILPDPYYKIVEALWNEVDQDCGLHQVKPGDIPHFSWHVAETYDTRKLTPILKKFCDQARPFTVKTAGLGMFTAEKCVLYISLVTDMNLLQFHTRLWDCLQGDVERVSPHYAPGKWVPHISLADEGLGEKELSCAISSLACKPLLWELTVDHLAVIGESSSDGGNFLRIPFGGK